MLQNYSALIIKLAIGLGVLFIAFAVSGIYREVHNTEARQTAQNYSECLSLFRSHIRGPDGRASCETASSQIFVDVDNLQSEYDSCVEQFGKDATSANSSCFNTETRRIYFEPPKLEVFSYEECVSSYTLGTLVEKDYCIDKNGRLFEKDILNENKSN